MSVLPSVTVVTPSFNQGRYLEDTILSVLSQGIPGLQYVVMDGGSTDDSVSIIKKYQDRLHYWTSAPDGGQAAAIHAGFSKGTGEILCYVNSDDTLEPGVLAKVQRLFAETLELQFLYGDYCLLYPDGRREARPKVSYDFEICLRAFLMIPQPSSFWRRSLYEAVGGFNAKYRYAFDYDFFLRMGQKLAAGDPNQIRHVHDLWSNFRLHADSKSVAEKSKFGAELRDIRKQFGVGTGASDQLRSWFQLLRLSYRFHRERGFFPTRKSPGKA